MCFKNIVLIIYYIRHVLIWGYKVPNFIKNLKGYRVHRARISDIKRGKKRREPCSRRLKKGEGRKRTFFYKTKKREDLIIFSVR